jgi:uncharacterized membrane protein
MPNLGVFHPQVVHFVIALLLVGVLLRLVSLLNRWPWMHPAATMLLVLGAGASVVAVRSGDDAHGPVERVPGSRPVVVEHEEWGERTRNLFLAIAAVELVGLALAENRRRLLRYASAALGLAGAFAVYETGEHGGELVYSYAGGVGIRTGEPEDVSRLLLAGLYHQAMLDRSGKRPAEAAALFEQMAGLFPDDPSIQLLAVESVLRDRMDLAGARKAIDAVNAPADDARLRRAIATLKADIHIAAGHRDSARAILEPLLAETPTNARLQAKLDSLK